MNRISFLIRVLTLMVVVTSCSRNYPEKYPSRVIKFSLHTEKDFSHETGNITFSLFIRSHNRVLFDSTLSTMRIKDIPDSTNKLIFEKKVPDDDGSELAAGFRYGIQNVGNSWYLDTIGPMDAFKIVDFSFR